MSVLDMINNLIEEGYSDEEASRVAAMLTCPDEDLFDIWSE